METAGPHAATQLGGAGERLWLDRAVTFGEARILSNPKATVTRSLREVRDGNGGLGEKMMEGYFECLDDHDHGHDFFFFFF